MTHRSTRLIVPLILCLFVSAGCAAHHDHPAPGFVVATNSGGYWKGIRVEGSKPLDGVWWTRLDAVEDTWREYHKSTFDLWYPVTEATTQLTAEAP